MRSLNVLVACEESQRVCMAFRKRGDTAYSADIQEPSGGHPEWHILGDCLPLLHPVNGMTEFVTMDGTRHGFKGQWDIIIAHPPCTYLTVSGNRWFNADKYGQKAIDRKYKQHEAIKFFMEFINADCEHIAVENPVGVMASKYRKPDNIIQPCEHGHPVRKTTCLWLKGLPMLKPTNIVQPEIKSGGYSGAAWAAKDENGKIIAWNDPRTKKYRSKTFEGIAEAMAEQWGDYVSRLDEK